jgi:hypothetical protein
VSLKSANVNNTISAADDNDMMSMRINLHVAICSRLVQAEINATNTRPRVSFRVARRGEPEFGFGQREPCMCVLIEQLAPILVLSSARVCVRSTDL